MTRNTHGGKLTGAGRPKVYGPRFATTIQLTKDEIETLDDDDINEQIKMMVKETYEELNSMGAKTKYEPRRAITVQLDGETVQMLQALGEMGFGQGTTDQVTRIVRQRVEGIKKKGQPPQDSPTELEKA
jgi:hypothetical protein